MKEKFQQNNNDHNNIATKYENNDENNSHKHDPDKFYYRYEGKENNSLPEDSQDQISAIYC